MALPLHVVILAAGEGTRMRSRLPKVLQPLGGKPMLAHVVAAATSLKPAAIHIVYGYAGDQVRSYFSDRPDLHWFEQSSRCGTGHAVLQALPHIPDAAKVLVLYGDVPLIEPQTLEQLCACSAVLSLLAARLDEPFGYGRILETASGCVAAIVEDRECTPEQLQIKTVNTGFICADAGPLKQWLALTESMRSSTNEHYLTSIFAMAAAQGTPATILCVNGTEQILGANDQWQLAQLERQYQLKQIRQLALQGVRFADPARVDQRGMVKVGRDVSIDVNVVFEGQVVLEEGVAIGPFVRLKNVHLGPNTCVFGHCDLDGVITKAGVQIGPFARLRPGTDLDENVHIGNFVETKNTKIGSSSKANHLTYLGDAQIGRAVNIGAGTITCNYDGRQKSSTTIADNAFIGSNTALVAPIQIGINAVIGAGSVVTTNAPDGSLTIARSRQKTIHGYTRAKIDGCGARKHVDD